MCGITGIFNLHGEPVSPVILRHMTTQVSHRGPDGEGFFIDGFLGLGHRRLAILDLSTAGHQPMLSSDGQYVISYNGEVYNHLELRADLEKKGFKFRSTTDTEVIVNGYAAYGPHIFEKLNGMFAVAIWDKKELTLTLARDRHGTKPLYWTQLGQSILFGSEIKAFFPHPSFTIQPDPNGFSEYCAFQNFFTTRTLFKGVSLLPAAHFVQLRVGDSSFPNPKQYWDYKFQTAAKVKTHQEYVEELDHLFTRAVRRQLMSDVELGSYLSGGIDSGSITALAAKQMPYMKTFTCGFDLNSASGLELAFDERQSAEYLSYLFKTEHYEVVLKAGDMERILPRLTWHLEEPRVGQSYPIYYVAQLAGKFVKVVLSGAGGDELFAGYPWRYYRAVVNSDFVDYSNKYFEFWQRLMPEDLLKKAVRPINPSVSEDFARQIFRSVFPNNRDLPSTPEDYVNHSLYFEAKTFLPGLLLVDDKLSMAHGLETRVPFLDNDLVDFACSVPVNLKLGQLAEVVRLNENEPGPKAARYYQRHKDGKLILRQMLERHVPKELSEREKQGFSGPDSSWFKGDSIKYVERKLLKGKPRIFELLDRSSLEPLLRSHLDGTENRRLLVWSLLYLENWCEQFLGRPKSDLTHALIPLSA